MNKHINAAWFSDLLAEHQTPYISLYQPMNRANPPAAENERRFRNLVERAEAALNASYDAAMVSRMIGKLRSVVSGEEFWTGDRDGIAIFASPDHLQVIDLLQAPEELLVVSDSFHIKPLIRILQSGDRYQLLCLELKNVRVFEGNQFRIERLEMRHLPQNPSEVAGMSMSSHSDSASDLMQSSRQADEGGGDTEAVPVEVFMRAVDRAVWENYSRPSGLPLILCADERTNAAFRAVSKNPQLMEQSIMLDPHILSPQRLCEEAWKLMEPIYQRRMETLVNDFRTAKARQKGSDDVVQVAEAASTGRVDTLLVGDGKHIAGKLLRHSGLLEPASMTTHPQGDDVLDDLAEMVLRQDGHVLILPDNAMPTDTGVAAIYRY
jgi:hypothetical protein